MITAVFALMAYIAVALFAVLLSVVHGTTAGGDVLSEFGRNIALAVFPILLLQPILVSRFGWIERSVDSSSLLRFHKAMGVFALVAAFLHPLALALGGAGINLLTSWDFPWFIILGKVSLIILVIHVALALLRPTLKLNYGSWKTLHTGAALFVTLGVFGHSWFAGTDLQNPAIQAFWVALVILSVVAIVLRKTRKPASFKTGKFVKS